MYSQQFFIDGLGCASYIVGCEAKGVAAIVDPDRDIQKYLDAASSRSLTITHIIETHLHADHLCGSKFVHAFIVNSRICAADEAVTAHDLFCFGIPGDELFVAFFAGVENVKVAVEPGAAACIAEGEFAEPADFAEYVGRVVLVDNV